MFMQKISWLTNHIPWASYTRCRFLLSETFTQQVSQAEACLAPPNKAYATSTIGLGKRADLQRLTPASAYDRL